ncbi:MAG: hypothetical protein ACLT9Y_00130 [Peptostreptococcus anaerobius]
MIKVEIDVNVKGLDFLKGLLGPNLGSAENMVNAPAWTTNEVPKENIPQPVVPEQPAPQTPQTPAQPVTTAPVSEVAYTLPQLQTAATQLVQSGKIQGTDLFPILQGLGVNAMSDLTPDKFNDFALKLKELGGVI